MQQANGNGDTDDDDEGDTNDNGDGNYEQWKNAWVHFHPVALLQLQAMHSPNGNRLALSSRMIQEPGAGLQKISCAGHVRTSKKKLGYTSIAKQIQLLLAIDLDQDLV